MNSPLIQFGRTIKGRPRLALGAVLLLFLPILALITGLIPPWPGPFAVTVTTLVLEIVFFIAFYISLAEIRHARLLWGLRASAASTLASVIAYMFLSAALVYDAPDSRHRIVGGFVLIEDVKRLLPTLPGISLGEVLAGAEYDANQIWTGNSIAIARVSLLSAWLLVCTSLTFFYTVIVTMDQNRDRRPRSAMANEEGLG